MNYTLWIYAFVAGFIVFLGLIYFGFQFIGHLIMGNNGKPIDEEQRTRCHDAIDKGEALSRMCKIYVKRGLCPHDSCKVKTQK
jgi:hypothetical protein